MKYTAKQYAQAVFEALEEKPQNSQKEIMARFLKLLVKNGDWKRQAAILKALEKLILRQKKLRKVQVESPQEISKTAKSEIEKIFNQKIYLSEKLNPSLLGGIKILVDDEILIDASAKRQMEKLFQK